MRSPIPHAPNLKRYRQIVTVLARHGFGSFLEHIRVGQRVPLSQHLVKPDTRSHLSPAEHFRLALEELGPTFVKVGQILSTRPDLLGPEFVKELSKLTDAVPPAPWEQVHEVLVEELGNKLDETFEWIDPLPLAAASLAQVHNATLVSGDEVVVKIQRPKIQAIIDTDLAILRDQAFLAQHSPLGELTSPEQIVEEFAFALYNELDYLREGRNADRFRENFKDEKYLYIPKIYWEYTTRRVLVMEKIHGIKIDDLNALDEAGYDRKRVAMHAASIIVKEILQDGFFHADPHAGNFLVMAGEVIGAMDFGLVGEITDRDRNQLIHLYISSIGMDARNMVDELIRINAASSSVNRANLALDLERMMKKYSGRPLKEIRTQDLMDEMMNLTTRHHLTLPPNLWLLGKTMAMMEGTGLKLDPDFDIFSVSEPYVRQLKWQVFLPETGWGNNLLRQGVEWGELIKILPRASRRLLEKIDLNQPFDVTLENSDKIMSGLNRLVNRLSISVVLAALIISMAILIATTTDGSPLQTLVAVGFITAMGLSAWLIISIFRGTN